jgi:hypothetical protein
MPFFGSRAASCFRDGPVTLEKRLAVLAQILCGRRSGIRLVAHHPFPENAVEGRRIDAIGVREVHSLRDPRPYGPPARLFAVSSWTEPGRVARSQAAPRAAPPGRRPWPDGDGVWIYEFESSQALILARTGTGGIEMRDLPVRTLKQERSGQLHFTAEPIQAACRGECSRTRTSASPAIGQSG